MGFGRSHIYYVGLLLGSFEWVCRKAWNSSHHFSPWRRGRNSTPPFAPPLPLQLREVEIDPAYSVERDGAFDHLTSRLSNGLLSPMRTYARYGT